MREKIEIRFFMFLAELCKERSWTNPMLMEIDDEISGLLLLEKMDIPVERVEALMINGHVALPADAVIRAGNRVALLPPGTPGPYRVLLGFKNDAMREGE